MENLKPYVTLNDAIRDLEKIQDHTLKVHTQVYIYQEIERKNGMIKVLLYKLLEDKPHYILVEKK